MEKLTVEQTIVLLEIRFALARAVLMALVGITAKDKPRVLDELLKITDPEIALREFHRWRPPGMVKMWAEVPTELIEYQFGIALEELRESLSKFQS